jgi:hypothetical protein
MMRETPRTFVGPVVFLLDGPAGEGDWDLVHREVGRVPGVSFCGLDVAARTLVVTAEAPVDRTEVVALLDRLGLRVRT